MPVFDTTHNIKKIIDAINDYLGMPIPFLQRFKRGGIGSRRMVVDDLSPALEPYINARHYLTYSNLELRPQGVMVHIHKTLDTFSWCVLYEDITLEFLENKQVRLEAEGEFILFRDGYKFNHKFFDQLRVTCQQHKNNS